MFMVQRRLCRTGLVNSPLSQVCIPRCQLPRKVTQNRMTITTQPRTIGELRESGYRLLSIKEELRKNLIQKIRRGEELFPGIIGYDDTVIPQVENAILSGHDIIFLSQPRHSKTPMPRCLLNLLDEVVPVIAGCE